jgi:diguanylate cyclase (GGDEF)-like protein
VPGGTSWELLRRVIEAQLDAVCLYQVADLRVLASNPTWASRHDAVSDDVVGRPLDQLLVGPELDALRRQVLVLGPDHRESGTTVSTNRRDGTVETIEWIDRWLPDEGPGQILSVGRDVTAQRATELALAASEARARRLTEMLPNGVIELDHDLVVLAVNPAWRAIAGDDLDVGDPFELVLGRIHHDDVASVEGLLAAVVAPPEVESGPVTFRFCPPGRAEVWIELRVVPTGDGGVLCAAVDRTAELAERRRADRLARSLDSSPDAALVLDGTGRVEYVNVAATSLGFAVGERFEDAISRLAADQTQHGRSIVAGVAIAGQQGRWQGEIVLRSPAGLVVPVSVTCTASYRDGRVEFVAVLTRDLSDERMIQARLVDAATHDPLTGLVNRRGLDAALTELVGFGIGLVVVDLDGFKHVNDTLGHQVGDLVLRAAGRRLLGAIRAGTDTVARLGGDEFLLACPGLTEHAVRRLGSRVVELLADPVATADGDVCIGASVGLALRDPGESWGAALRRADIAMYEAKRDGGGARWGPVGPDGAAPATGRLRRA